MKQLLLVGFIVSLLILTACSTGEELIPFAECLTENGAKMYGTYWCSHCISQKKGFGSAWDSINYIECSLPGGKGQTAICERAGIEGYPTWEFADGSRMSGEVPHETLAEKTGCVSPS